MSTKAQWEIAHKLKVFAHTEQNGNSDQGIIKIVDKQTYVPTPGEKATIIFK